MQKNDLIKMSGTIFRVLELQEERAFVIDCVKKSMPDWIRLFLLDNYQECTEAEMVQETRMIIPDMEKLDAESRRFIREHYTLIAPVLPFVSDEKQRNYVINRIATEKGVSKQTIRKYLCLYLVYHIPLYFAQSRRKNGN